MDRNADHTLDMVRIAVMVCALASLAIVCAHFMLQAFERSASAGLRSTAGILLPFVIGGFLAAFRRSLFERIALVPSWLAFATAAGFGVAVMLLIRHAAALYGVPVAELVVASGLSVFVYTPGAVLAGERPGQQREVWVAYYFGVVSGMLGYVVAIGMPTGAA